MAIQRLDRVAGMEKSCERHSPDLPAARQQGIVFADFSKNEVETFRKMQGSDRTARSKRTAATGERRLDGKGFTPLKNKRGPLASLNMFGKIRIGLFFANAMKTSGLLANLSMVNDCPLVQKQGFSIRPKKLPEIVSSRYEALFLPPSIPHFRRSDAKLSFERASKMGRPDKSTLECNIRYLMLSIQQKMPGMVQP